MTIEEYNNEDYDNYHRDYYHDKDYHEEVPEEILLPLSYPRQKAPVPFNLKSLKKEKEESVSFKKEQEKQQEIQEKIELFNSAKHTGIWGLPGWMVPKREIVAVVDAKEKLHNDLATGQLVIVSKENEKKDAEEDVEKKELEEAGFKLVKKENKRDTAFEVLSDKEKMKKEFQKTELCVSVLKGIECPHGGEKNCRFLHDVSEWKPRECRFGDSCKMVKIVDKNGKFFVLNRGGDKNKICKFKHGSLESIDNYYTRTKTTPPAKTDKKIEEILPVQKKVIIMSPVVKVSVWKQEPLQKVCSGVVSIPEVTKESTTVKEIKINLENNKTRLCNSVISGEVCRHQICRYAHSVEELSIKECKFDRCRNVVYIKDGVYKNVLGMSCCWYMHKNETRESVYSRLDISKYQCVKSVVATTLQKVTTIVPSISSIPKINWVKVKQETKYQGMALKNVSEKKLEEKMAEKKLEEKMAEKKLEEKMAEKKVVEKKVEDNDGWVISKTKTEKKQEIKKIREEINNNNTALCRSFLYNTVCTHSKCRFAHDLESLRIKDCKYGKFCKEVCMIADGLYINNSDRVCLFRHEEESRDSCYKRFGINRKI